MILGVLQAAQECKIRVDWRYLLADAVKEMLNRAAREIDNPAGHVQNTANIMWNVLDANFDQQWFDFAELSSLLISGGSEKQVPETVQDTTDALRRCAGLFAFCSLRTLVSIFVFERGVALKHN